MTAINSYATLGQFKLYVTSPSQSLASSLTDDAVIESLLEAASRYIDSQTGRKFYPSVDVSYYDTPEHPVLDLDDDLLEVITLINGDGVEIPATDYTLLLYNRTPHYAIRLRNASPSFWTGRENGFEAAIELTAIVGYHERYYQQGWRTGSTLSGALNNSNLSFSVVSGAGFESGQIIRVDNELMIIDSVNINAITVLMRGDNGSSAAAHDAGKPVQIWQTQSEVRQATLEIANMYYHRRFGDNLSAAVSTITTGGVVITPRDVTETAAAIIKRLKRRL